MAMEAIMGTHWNMAETLQRIAFMAPFGELKKTPVSFLGNNNKCTILLTRHLLLISASSYVSRSTSSSQELMERRNEMRHRSPDPLHPKRAIMEVRKC